MLGGLKLRIGDQLIDGSVATRLRKLRSNLLTKGRFHRPLPHGIHVRGRL